MMPKTQTLLTSEVSHTRDLFTSRAPRNSEEIETCVAMLEDSPFWDPARYTLNRRDIVRAWVDLLSRGRGYIDIIENEAWKPVLGNGRGRSGDALYKHNFHVVFFICSVTFEFAREIITRNDIHDIHMHFLQSILKHQADASQPCPAMTTNQIHLGLKKLPEHGLYCFNTMVIHPAFDAEGKHKAPPQLMERLRRTPIQIVGGRMHHAWITNVVTESNKDAYIQFGHRLLREYFGNDGKPPDKRKYIFCLTKNREVSAALGVSAQVEVNIDSKHLFGNWYRNFFDGRRPHAGLNRNEQQTCFLIMLGYTREQIAGALSCTVGCVDQYQNKAATKLYDAGYHDIAAGFRPDNSLPKYNRETISKVIFDNLHEVRSYVFPLYPWPEGVVLR